MLLNQIEEAKQIIATTFSNIDESIQEEAAYQIVKNEKLAKLPQNFDQWKEFEKTRF